MTRDSSFRIQLLIFFSDQKKGFPTKFRIAWNTTQYPMQGWFEGLARIIGDVRGCCIPENNKNFSTASLPPASDKNIDTISLSLGANGRRNKDEISDLCNIIQPEHRLENPEFYNRTSTNLYSERILRAAEDGDTTLLIATLKEEEHLIQGKDPFGNTALHVSAINGHSELCNLLCQVKENSTVLRNRLNFLLTYRKRSRPVEPFYFVF